VNARRRGAPLTLDAADGPETRVAPRTRASSAEASPRCLLSPLIVLAANQSSAQQQMLTYDAHRVFHVQHHTIRLDLERSRLLAPAA
jgi:hypothetical protein